MNATDLRLPNPKLEFIVQNSVVLQAINLKAIIKLPVDVPGFRANGFWTEQQASFVSDSKSSYCRKWKAVGKKLLNQILAWRREWFQRGPVPTAFLTHTENQPLNQEGVVMDQNIEQKINEAKTYREKAILFLLLAFDDDNDRRIKHIYENIRLVSQGGQS